MLDSSVYFRFYSCFIDISLNVFYYGFDVSFTLCFLLCNCILEFVICFGLKILEGKVIEFNLDPADTETLCNGTIDIHCLTCNPDLACGRLILERTHIVETVREFDQNDSDIACHRIKHLTKIFGLYLKLFIRLIGSSRKRNILQLCNTRYKECYFIAEFLSETGLRHFGIFKHVMKKRSGNGLLIHLEFCQNNGNIERMDDIRLTGFSDLTLVCIISEGKCLFDH